MSHVLIPVLLCLAQAPTPGVGTPNPGLGAPVGVTYVRVGSSTIANTTDEVTVLGSSIGSMTLAANILVPGRTFRIINRGTIGTTGNPTLRFRAYAGTTVIVDTGAVALPGVPVGANFVGGVVVTCRTTGVTGTVVASGDFTFQTTLGQLTTGTNWAPITTSTIDTTKPITFKITAQWGTASPSNTLVFQLGTAEVLY